MSVRVTLKGYQPPRKKSNRPISAERRHSIDCLRRWYEILKQEVLLDDDECVTTIPKWEIYEVNVTCNQVKQTWSQAERSFMDRVETEVKKCCEGWMLFKEHQENGWIHAHGIIWFPTRQSSHRYLGAQLNKKIGNTVIQKLRDGIEIQGKRYNDWFEYMTKDVQKEGGYYTSFPWHCRGCEKFISVI